FANDRYGDRIRPCDEGCAPERYLPTRLDAWRIKINFLRLSFTNFHRNACIIRGFGEIADHFVFTNRLYGQLQCQLLPIALGSPPELRFAAPFACKWTHVLDFD